jgi:hypothetical protein
LSKTVPTIKEKHTSVLKVVLPVLMHKKCKYIIKKLTYNNRSKYIPYAANVFGMNNTAPLPFPQFLLPETG